MSIGTAMCHILIIEDEPFVAMNIQMLLEDEGVTSFEIASTEAEAVAAAMDRRPDLITSDVRLLEGTGPRAVAEILARLGHVPVIFITGTPSECVPAPASALILRKPLQRGALEAAFRQLR
jgi:CheY-like chemotaxis protein